ncbi:MAG: cytochrome c [Sphingobacteriales bacterium]|nr:MAG: cytochrome c [Sphingobacteriales bacterium]
MKKFKIFSVLAIAAASATIVGCNAGGNNPGRSYMPDMAYSRAYEAYASHDSSIVTTDESKRGGKAFYYNAHPVPGTVKRGEELPYTGSNDSTGYRLSASLQNPIKDMSIIEMPEAQRLWQINCAICHGDKGAGNGPLSLSGKVGGVANLTLPMYVSMTDGTMFHSVTYGRNLMGSYASQLDRRQRWMVINYIRTLQPAAEAPAPAATDTTKKG